MRAEIQRRLLKHIGEEWESLRRGPSQPWGAWIGRYPRIAGASDTPLGRWAVPLSAWFLDPSGVSRRSVWEYRRFFVMQVEQPWCKRPFGEPHPTGGRFFEIGHAAFAPGPVDDEFYVETLWGGLYGEGRIVTPGPEGEVRKKRRLWIA